jgi:uncharacterized metal-binding protein YceD (DUF177 family)
VTPPLSRKVRVAEIAAGGTPVDVRASEAERAALAAEFGLLGVDRLDARLVFRRLASGVVEVRGRLEADVVYPCVVTLEPVPGRVEEEIEARFADGPSPRQSEVEVDALAADPPEPIVGGAIDAGAIAAEFLALGLDPYPRAPGAALEPGPAEAVHDERFAALARLATPRKEG